MDMTDYDANEVARIRARPDCHGAKMRFAIHVRKVSPTHVWPHLFFAMFDFDDLEKSSHLRDAISAWDRQLAAERDGTATRRRDPGEKRLYRQALYQFMKLSARLGEPADAAWAVSKLLQVDPKDRGEAVEMARHLGVYPVVVGGTEHAMSM